MIREYIDAAMTGAQYEDPVGRRLLVSDEIPGFQGVWANNDTLEECRIELEEVLEEWLLFSISRNFDVPVIPGVGFPISRK